MQHGSYDDPRRFKVGSAAEMQRAQEHVLQEKAAGLASAKNSPLSKGQYDCATAEPRMLDALTTMLREVRNRTNMAVTNLDGFLARATGEGSLPPPGPATVGPVQSPLHEAADLLGEISTALNTLENIQSRVDRIA